MDRITLYHAGFDVIEKPDIHYGRKNADFGQGFYLTQDKDFALRWARERNGKKTYINYYELDPDGLDITRFSRGEEWYGYIFNNRAGYCDGIKSDVITGPVANDTLYDTYGVLTSGLLSPRDSLKLLLIGGEYNQTVIKTEKALSKLRWIKAEEIKPDEISVYRQQVRLEEAEYQSAFMSFLNSSPRFSSILDMLT